MTVATFDPLSSRTFPRAVAASPTLLSRSIEAARRRFADALLPRRLGHWAISPRDLEGV